MIQLGPFRCIDCGVPKARADMRYVNKQSATGQCNDCRVVYRAEVYARDPQAAKDYQREWKRRNPDKVTEYGRRHRHGVEPEEYDALVLAQEGRCAICGRADEILKIDHCHSKLVVQADVAELDPPDYGPCDLLIAFESVRAYTRRIAAGYQPATVEWADDRSALVTEPVRWALALRPRRIALEQVPPVLEYWKYVAEILRHEGYSVWTGVLSAERYGVPQTRKRAILIASLDGQVGPPEPTHQAYVPGEPAEAQVGLFGSVLPWVSMAEALGWGLTARPSVTVLGKHEGGGREGIDGGSGSRRTVREARDDGAWVERRPATTIAGSNPGVMNPNGGGPAVSMSERGYIPWAQERPATNVNADPRIFAPEYRGGRRDYERGIVKRAGGTVSEGAPLRDESQDSLDAADWPEARPATTIAGDSRVFAPERRQRNPDYQTGDPAVSQGNPGNAAVRVTLQEAAILQGFPPDHPWQGSRTKQFEQVGNAVPPPLARAILTQLLDITMEAAA